MTDEDEKDDHKVVTMQEARARRDQKKYEAAGNRTQLVMQRFRFEVGERPSDLIQKLIDIYTRMQVASAAEAGEFVTTPVQMLLDNLHAVQTMYQYAEHFAMAGVAAPTSQDIGVLHATVHHPLAAFEPPQRPVPKLHVVESCSVCPMEYDGYCGHPGAPNNGDPGGRINDCEEHNQAPHPRCPLKTKPIYMRVRP